MTAFYRYNKTPERVTCEVCGRTGGDISRALGVCRKCITGRMEEANEAITRFRLGARTAYSTPAVPPRSSGGSTCRICANECRMAPGELGFCGLRENLSGNVHSRAGTSRAGIFRAYHDPLPTNCVADWVCPGCSDSGYPRYSHSRGPERGFANLAVFLGACSFDCLFCQNWSFRDDTEALSPLRTPGDLAEMVDSRTSCVCFFGGDPSPQMPFALAASRMALERVGARILRICWETNGSMHPGLLRRAVGLSLESGGCVKFDIKASDDNLHRALTGVSNRRTLDSIAMAVELTRGRPDPPPVIVSTLMVPGYVGEEEVSAISGYLASLDPDIPYTLLAFHPDYLMDDMGTTTGKWADECVSAARDAGLYRVKLGNLHLLS